MHNFLKKIIEKVNFNLSRDFWGARFKIPILNGLGISNLTLSEEWMVDALKYIFDKEKSGGVFLDIGVNIGQTLLKLKSIDESIEYVGFEPNPACIYYCNKLISINNFNNCTILPVGLFNKDDILKLNFYSEKEDASGSSLLKEFRPDTPISSYKYVPVFRFEKIKDNLSINDISVIKIDVEGAELEIIKSLLTTIDNYQPVIILEVLPNYNQSNKNRLNRQNKIAGICKELNYKIYRILKDKKAKFEDFEEIREFGIHSDLNKCDYLLAPSGITIDKEDV